MQLLMNLILLLYRRLQLFWENFEIAKDFSRLYYIIITIVTITIIY